MANNDLGNLFTSHDHVKRWTAERENASARLQLARQAEAINILLSQHEPIHSLGIDREALRVALDFIIHGDKHRLNREVAKHLEERNHA
jgi:hypothetical protein